MRSPALFRANARIVPLRRQTTCARTGSWRNGGRPGSATARFQESTQRNPVGSTRPTAVTSSRFASAIGSGPSDVAATTANSLSVESSRRAKPGALAARPAGDRLGERRVDHQAAVRRVPAGQRRTLAAGLVPTGRGAGRHAAVQQRRGVREQGVDVRTAVDDLGELEDVVAAD